MVFLIQNTQNRESVAIQLKLDELIRAIEGARSSLVDLEDASERDLGQLQHEFQRLRERQARQPEAADREPERHDPA
jgi:low affinity Fe/Cu permease